MMEKKKVESFIIPLPILEKRDYSIADQTKATETKVCSIQAVVKATIVVERHLK
jgi:hypothetical protein